MILQPTDARFSVIESQCAFSWLSTDAPMLSVFKVRAERIPIAKTASLLQSYAGLLVMAAPVQPPLFRDWLNLAFRRVDWVEVARALLDGEQ